jgi:hypothetical protein
LHDRVRSRHTNVDAVAARPCRGRDDSGPHCARRSRAARPWLGVSAGPSINSRRSARRSR